MTSGRMRRRAALMTVALALAACAGGDQGGNAGAQTPSPPASIVGPGRAQPVPTTPGSEPGTAAADQAGVTSTTTPGSIPSAAGGAQPGAATSGTGSPPPAEASTGGGAPTAAAPPVGNSGSGAGAGPPEPATTDAPSGGGSRSAALGVSVAPEDCALLRQLMAIVDHPQLHQLKADTGC